MGLSSPAQEDELSRVAAHVTSPSRPSRRRLAAASLHTAGGMLIGLGVILLGLSVYPSAAFSPAADYTAASYLLDGIGFIVFSLGFVVANVA